MKLKAIEILTKLKEAKTWEEYYPSNSNCKEAIAELKVINENKTLSLIAEEHNNLVNQIEELRNDLKILKNKTCDNCNNFKQIHKSYPRKQCSILSVGDIGGCNVYWESKC